MRTFYVFIRFAFFVFGSLFGYLYLYLDLYGLRYEEWTCDMKEGSRMEPNAYICTYTVMHARAQPTFVSMKHSWTYYVIDRKNARDYCKLVVVHQAHTTYMTDYTLCSMHLQRLGLRRLNLWSFDDVFRYSTIIWNFARGSAERQWPQPARKSDYHQFLSSV